MITINNCAYCGNPTTGAICEPDCKDIPACPRCFQIVMARTEEREPKDILKDFVSDRPDRQTFTWDEIVHNTLCYLLQFRHGDTMGRNIVLVDRKEWESFEAWKRTAGAAKSADNLSHGLV
jgi:hypothetical protein